VSVKILKGCPICSEHITIITDAKQVVTCHNEICPISGYDIPLQLWQHGSIKERRLGRAVLEMNKILSSPIGNYENALILWNQRFGGLVE